MSVLDKIKSPGWVRKRPTRGSYVVTRAGSGEVISPDPGGRLIPSVAASASSRDPRPYVGFDREKDAYAHARPGLLRTSPGRFVVFVGDEMAGPFPTFHDALRAGYRRFGFGPLYVKRVQEEEPIIDLGPAS